MATEILRKRLLEDVEGALLETKLQAGDVIRLEIKTKTLSFHRPKTSGRLLIENDKARTLVSISPHLFMEIVYLVSAATGLGYVIAIETDGKIEVKLCQAP